MKWLGAWELFNGGIGDVSYCARCGFSIFGVWLLVCVGGSWAFENLGVLKMFGNLPVVYFLESGGVVKR